jgi:hypothetical protein
VFLRALSSSHSISPACYFTDREKERERDCVGGWMCVCVCVYASWDFFPAVKKDFLFYFLEQRTGPLHIHTLIRYIRRRPEQAENSLDKSFFLPPSYSNAFQSLSNAQEKRERWVRAGSIFGLTFWSGQASQSASGWVFSFELDTTTCSSFVCLFVCLVDCLSFVG